ncbi:unnamed protein product [Prunus armeniaca]
MMFNKFWTQSDIDWSMKLDDSGSYDVRSEMEWLVDCIVLSIGFHSKHTEWLLPPYYDVPQVLDSIRYRLVREIGRFRFFYPLDFTQNTPNDSSHHIMMFNKFWTQSDIDWSMKLDDSGSYDVRSEMEWLVDCIVLSIGFHSKHTEWLLPPYYDVPQVLDSIRYRLVREIGRFRFVRCSF